MWYCRSGFCQLICLQWQSIFFLSRECPWEHQLWQGLLCYKSFIFYIIIANYCGQPHSVCEVPKWILAKLRCCTGWSWPPTLCVKWGWNSQNWGLCAYFLVLLIEVAKVVMTAARSTSEGLVDHHHHVAVEVEVVAVDLWTDQVTSIKSDHQQTQSKNRVTPGNG